MHILFDVTTTIRFAYQPPVGTTRVERTILSDLVAVLGIDRVTCVNHDKGRFVLVDPAEREIVRRLAESPSQQLRREPVPPAPPPVPPPPPPAPPPPPEAPSFSMRSGFIRRFPAVRYLLRPYLWLFPYRARALAAQGAWEIFSGAIITLRALRHTVVPAPRARRRAPEPLPALPPPAEPEPVAAVAEPDPDFPALTRDLDPAFDPAPYSDLILIGNGWDYLDYERLEVLREEHGIRIHGFVHDLIAIYQPQLFHDVARASALHQHYAELCNLCSSLICNSYATRDALERFIEEEGLPRPRIAVAQLPVLEAKAAAKRPAFADRLGGEDFVLFVSTIEVRKNHQLLLKIWRECLLEGRRMPRLVFVGRPGWGVETVFKSIHSDPVLDGRVEVVHDLGDEELLWLYDTCLFTLYPSQIEGWGLPIGEALGRGRICVHSTDPAQKEAAQGLMPSLHPDDFQGWKQTVVDLVERPGRRERLESMIREAYRPIRREAFCAAVRAALEIPEQPAGARPSVSSPHLPAGPPPALPDRPPAEALR